MTLLYESIKSLKFLIKNLFFIKISSCQNYGTPSIFITGHHEGKFPFRVTTKTKNPTPDAWWIINWRPNFGIVIFLNLTLDTIRSELVWPTVACPSVKNIIIGCLSSLSLLFLCSFNATSKAVSILVPPEGLNEFTIFLAFSMFFSDISKESGITWFWNYNLNENPRNWKRLCYNEL